MTAAQNSRPKLTWDSLFASGVVIDIDVSVWRARTSIKPADLGIENSEEVHKVLALGCHRLIPKESLDRIKELAAQAKRTLEYYSMSFPFVYGVRYVPDRAQAELIAKLTDIQQKIDTAADEFAFSEYKDEKKKQLPIIYKALQDASRDQNLVAAAYERIEAEYPAPEDVRKKFGLKWRVFAISGSKSNAASTGAVEETESVKGVVKEMITQLRSEFTDKVGAVMAAVARGGKIPQPSVDSAIELMDRIDSMNVFGDSVLSEQVKSLRSVVLGAAGGTYSKKDSMGVVGNLSKMAELMDKSVDDAVAEAQKNLTALGRRKMTV